MGCIAVSSPRAINTMFEKLFLLFSVGIASLMPPAFTLLWIFFGVEGDYAGFSFSWKIGEDDDDSAQWRTMNWHPFLMSVAFGTLVTMSACAYKVMPGMTHTQQKIVHGVLNFLALVAASVSIFVIFEFKNKSGNMDLYTSHSWLGLLGFSLFYIQFIAGFVS